MKYFSICLLAFFGAFLPGLAAFSAPLEQTAFLPWGGGHREAGLEVVPDGRQGPQDIAFDADGSLWVLDSINERAFPVNASGAVRTVQPGAVLASFNGPRLVTVSATGRVETDDPALGLAAQSVALPYPTAFSFHGGLPVVWTGGAGVPVGAGTANAIVERTGLGSVVVTGADGSVSGAYSIALPGLVALTPIGLRPDGMLVAEAQTAPDGLDRGVARAIVIVSRAGKIAAALALPRASHAASRRNVRVAGDGVVHLMLPTAEGVAFWRWDGSPGAALPAAHETPEGGFAFDNRAPTPRAAPATPVKRSEALATAKTYVDHVWTASLKNITTTTCTDWCGNSKTIDPPDWVVEGQNTRFPYCWGGFSSVSSFDQGLLADKKAGDKQTKYASGSSACGSSCAVGVDCSGFISQCWTAGRHYGTSEMDQITTPISKSDLKAADSLNNAGSHTRMFIALRADGNWDMVESYAGSGYWGVGYTTRSPADNAAYDALRYNLIEEDTPQPHDPPTITHTPVTAADAGKDVIVTTKVTTSTGTVAAYNLRFRRPGDVDWTIVVFADKGGGRWDAVIPAASVGAGLIEYYLAIWDGESPVQEGRNRVTLPEDAETASHYFTFTVEAPDAGQPDTGAPDAGEVTHDAGQPDAGAPDAGTAAVLCRQYAATAGYEGRPCPAEGERCEGLNPACDGAAKTSCSCADGLWSCAEPDCRACNEGATRCAGTITVEVCSAGAWHAAASCGAGTACADGSCTAAAIDAGAGGTSSAAAGDSPDAGGEGGCSCTVITLGR